MSLVGPATFPKLWSKKTKATTKVTPYKPPIIQECLVRLLSKVYFYLQYTPMQWWITLPPNLWTKLFWISSFFFQLLMCAYIAWFKSECNGSTFIDQVLTFFIFWPCIFFYSLVFEFFPGQFEQHSSHLSATSSIKIHQLIFAHCLLCK